MNNYNLKNNYLPKKKCVKLRNGKPLRLVPQNVETWTTNNRTQFIPEIFPIGKISTNQMLSSLSDKSLSRLFPHLKKSFVSAGEYIYQSGDNVGCVYFPETTVLSEYQMLEDGKTIEIAMIGREGVNGLSAVFGAPAAENWTQVLIAGSVLKINTQILQQEFNRGGMLQLLFLGYANSYIKQISRKVICSSHHLIEGRLCSWLLALHDRNKNDILPVTQEYIAYLLGVHRPSVTLVAQSLRERKIIDYVRGQIFILNRQELEQSACLCYPATKAM